MHAQHVRRRLDACAVQGPPLRASGITRRESFIVALNKRTGEELWRVQRDEIDTWATPLVVEQGRQPQVIVPGDEPGPELRPRRRQVLWETAGLTMNPIPSPVFDDGFVFLMSGFRGNSFKAIELDGAKGDITNTPAVAWTMDRDTPYVPSPLALSTGLSIS